MLKFISGYENLYSIDENGNVFSHKKNQYMKCCDDNHGYNQISLSKNNKRTTYKIHRLVAETFISNPDNLPCVNHKDENRKNNNVNNLEWCSYYYNNHYGKRLERIQEKRELGCYDSQKKAIVKCDAKTGEELETFLSIADAEKAVNGNHSNIVACLKGRQKTSYGYKWKYVGD